MQQIPVQHTAKVLQAAASVVGLNMAPRHLKLEGILHQQTGSQALLTPTCDCHHKTTTDSFYNLFTTATEIKQNQIHRIKQSTSVVNIQIKYMKSHKLVPSQPYQTISFVIPSVL